MEADKTLNEVLARVCAVQTEVTDLHHRMNHQEEVTDEICANEKKSTDEIYSCLKDIQEEMKDIRTRITAISQQTNADASVSPSVGDDVVTKRSYKKLQDQIDSISSRSFDMLTESWKLGSRINTMDTEILVLKLSRKELDERIRRDEDLTIIQDKKVDDIISDVSLLKILKDKMRDKIEEQQREINGLKEENKKLRSAIEVIANYVSDGDYYRLESINRELK